MRAYSRVPGLFMKIGFAGYFTAITLTLHSFGLLQIGLPHRGTLMVFMISCSTASASSLRRMAEE